MTQAFVAVGSNIDPERNVLEALCLLAGYCGVTGVSTVYRTEAVGAPGRPRYYNCVARVETLLSPGEFKRSVLKRIESELGRVRSVDRFGDRTIDLDLILFGSAAISLPSLTIPDPEILKRPYLALPLYELAPGLALPGSGKRVSELAASMSTSGMEPLTDYTEIIRREVVRDCC